MASLPFAMIGLNSFALLVLVFTSLRVHADPIVAVAYAGLIACFCANIAHNVRLIAHRNRAKFRNTEFNGF
jgi:hypothetical protein